MPRLGLRYRNMAASLDVPVGVPRPHRACRRGRGLSELSGLREMPGAVEEAVAGDVAGLLVFRERIERLALVGPLLGAVVAADDGVAVARLVAGFGLQDQMTARRRARCKSIACSLRSP